MASANNDSENNKLVSIENVEAFVRDHSPEVVQGYLMALRDIVNESINITFAELDNNGGVLNPAGTVRRRMIDFYSSKCHLINRFKELGISLPKP